MRKPFTALLVVLATFSVSRAAAADEFDPAARAAAIAPYLDDQVIAVAHVDLKRIDVEAVFKEILAVIVKTEKAVPAGAGIEQEVRTTLSKTKPVCERWIAEFTRAGGRELYVVFSSPVPTQPVAHEKRRPMCVDCSDWVRSIHCVRNSPAGCKCDLRKE